MTSISKKIEAINKVTLNLMATEDSITIVKNFTDESIKIFNADFGYAWGKLKSDDVHELAYKSASMPYIPTAPIKNKSGSIDNIFFDSNVLKENYEPNVYRNMKSYLIIPIHYVQHIYGSIFLCYKNEHIFSEEELALAQTIGNTIAQALTINWLLQKEHQALELAKKQKETDTLLNQEKLKTEFIGNATHELRTPLAIMKGNVDLALLSKGDPKTLKDALKEVNLEINILSDILKDMALLTSAGKNISQVVRKTSVNLTELIDQTISRLKSIATEKKITIKANTNGDSKVFIKGDEKYLEKLFVNIIRNGIDYGKDNGHIIIDMHKENNSVKIKVTDTGIGISKEDLPKIFERFYRADKAHSSSGVHSGLGLAIAKWATEIHDGEIEVESVHGKGSTFTITLPLPEDR